MRFAHFDLSDLAQRSNGFRPPRKARWNGESFPVPIHPRGTGHEVGGACDRWCRVKDAPLYTRRVKPIRGGLLSAVGAALLLLALSPATSWATFPGANGRIAFVGWGQQSDPSGIFTVLRNGSGLQQLTSPSGGYPSWSADGERLVYIDRGGVFTMSADGENQTRVIASNGNLHGPPHFSPGGRRIVYASEPTGYPNRSGILTVRTDGTHKRRLVGKGAERPVWAPGSRRIAFDRWNLGNRNGIWKVSPDGSHKRRLTNPGQHNYDQLLDWSPDGQHILFYRCEPDIHFCDGSNWVMRADGSHEHPFQGPYGEVYSPSGRRFAGVTGEPDGSLDFGYFCSDIFTVNVVSGDRNVITHNCENGPPGDYGAFVYAPSWQPIPQP